VVGEYLPETRKVFEEKAEKERAPLIFAEDSQSVHFLRFENDSMKVLADGNTELEIGLCGEYQLKNVATVLAAVEKLRQIGFQISKEALDKGLKDVVSLTGLQGRWQTVKTSPRVVMDTGHNKAGFEYVAHQLKQQKYRKMHVVIGMVDDKDYSGVLSLLPKEAAYYFTAARTKRAVSPEELRREGEKYELKGTICDTVEEAVRAALADAEKDDFVFIGGSNYVVGEALPLFG
jgi:dihydrofolate synthase/folylpolyglutamate synthase